MTMAIAHGSHHSASIADALCSSTRILIRNNDSGEELRKQQNCGR